MEFHRPLLERQNLTPVSSRHTISSRSSSRLWLSVTQTFYQLHILTAEACLAAAHSGGHRRNLQHGPSAQAAAQQRGFNTLPARPQPYSTRAFSICCSPHVVNTCSGTVESMLYICGLNGLQAEARGGGALNTAVFQIKLIKLIKICVEVFSKNWKVAMENDCIDLRK